MRKIIELEQNKARKSFLRENPLKSTDVFRTVDGKVYLNYRLELIFKVVQNDFHLFMLSLLSEIYEDISRSRRIADSTEALPFHR